MIARHRHEATMSDEKALLAAIWAHPHEDTPRLMYADWLDEHGQSTRAEFIRVQCELAQLDEWDDVPRIEQLKVREDELWEAHRKAWTAELPARALHQIVFHRGFPAPRRQRYPGAKFLALRAGDYTAAPLWDFSLTGLYRNFDTVFAAPLLARAGALMVDLLKYPHDALAKLADNDRLRNVADLDFQSLMTVPPASLTAFFDGPATTAVTHLRFGGEVSGAAVDALAATRTAPRLRALQLMLTNPATAAGPLFAAKQFPRLRSLSLWGSTVPLSLFATDPDTPLRRLDFSSSRLGDAGTEKLAAWPGLARVRWLDMSYCSLRGPGYAALARSPYAGNLTYLRVDRYWLEQSPAVKAELDARFGAAVQYR
jgi:uncharacterized protein (TIGR02996 family)